MPYILKSFYKYRESKYSKPLQTEAESWFRNVIFTTLGQTDSKKRLSCSNTYIIIIFMMIMIIIVVHKKTKLFR